jgi:hypothetical protein
VHRWDPDGDGLMEGSSDSTSSRGLSSYNEEKFGRVGADLLAAQYIGNLDYSIMLTIRNRPDEAKDYRNRAVKIRDYLNSVWWDDHQKLYHHYIRYNGKWLDDNQMMSFLLRWGVVTPERAPAVAEHLIAVAPKTGVEMNTYYPLEVYRFGKPEDAYRLLVRLVSPDLKRREYPEVSYAAIETYAMGLMGIEADAGAQTVRTLPRLTGSTGWAELKDMPVFDGKITVRHDGCTKTTFTNHTSKPLTWVGHFANGKELLIRIGAGETKVATTE